MTWCYNWTRCLYHWVVVPLFFRLKTPKQLLRSWDFNQVRMNSLYFFFFLCKNKVPLISVTHWFHFLEISTASQNHWTANGRQKNVLPLTAVSMFDGNFFFFFLPKLEQEAPISGPVQLWRTNCKTLFFFFPASLNLTQAWRQLIISRTSYQ